METGKTIMQGRTDALRTLTEYISSHPGADRSCVPLLRPLIKCVFSSTEFADTLRLYKFREDHDIEHRRAVVDFVKAKEEFNRALQQTDNKAAGYALDIYACTEYTRIVEILGDIKY